MTLREYIVRYPDRADLPVAIMKEDGCFDFLGGAAVDFVEELEEDSVNGKKGEKILVFGNN